MTIPTHKPILKKTLYVFGWVSLILGGIGLLLPIVPTTPFLLVSAYCFSRSSPKIHRWLLNNKHFGPPIKDWHENGVISKKNKFMAVFFILISMNYPLVFMDIKTIPRVIIITLEVILILFISTRPSEKK